MDSLRVDYAVIVPPVSEPLSVNDLRSLTTGSYLRVDFGDDDAVLSALISQCRMLAEQATGKSFATQTIQAQYTMPQLAGDTLSGAQLLYDQDFYQYNESLGANPFSPAPFILKIPLPPLQSVGLFEYRITAFSPWQTWPQLQDDGVTANYQVDTLPYPGVVYLQYPPPAYQYRLTCSVGYTSLPFDLKQTLMELVAWKYDNREGDSIPDGIMNALMGRKTWVL